MERTTIAAVDIGGTKIAYGLVSIGEGPEGAPRLTRAAKMPTEAARGGAHVLERVIMAVRTLLDSAGGPVAGVGISSAGVVDPRCGDITFANDLMPGWGGTALAAEVNAACGLSCRVLNDVHAHALGEARWGAGQGAQTCVVAAAGTGLGGAIVTHGRIVRGAHGFAGELGATMNPLGADRAAGDDCLEGVAAGSGIEACYCAAGGEAISGAEISARANAGEELARRIIDQAGYALGLSLADLAGLLDPELAIVSGSVTKAGALWRHALQRGFEQRVAPVLRDLPIVDAQLGGDAPLIGAAEHARDLLADLAG